ncbi:hypothetical protein M8C21_030301, partial [Ambrosia artemisiifolia]
SRDSLTIQILNKPVHERSSKLLNQSIWRKSREPFSVSTRSECERVGIRLSLFANYNKSGDSDLHLLGVVMAESQSQLSLGK